MNDQTTNFNEGMVHEFYERRIDCLLCLELKDIVGQANKLFDCILKQRNASVIVERALSQHLINADTKELTGDAEFYIKLVEMMQDYPTVHRQQYEKEYDKAVNRFTLQFLQEFATPDGGINWAKLVQFNSGKDRPKQKRTLAKTKSQPGVIRESTLDYKTE